MNTIKEKIYQIVDSFLVEAKDQNGNDRSIERLNQDRHLAVEEIIRTFQEALESLQREEMAQNFPGLTQEVMFRDGWNAREKKLREDVSKFLS